MVKPLVQDRTVHLGLEYDRSSTHTVNAGTDSEGFASGVERELKGSGESDESSSLAGSEEYVVTILSNTIAGKNIEEDSFAEFVTPVLEEDDTSDEMPPLASKDYYNEVDDGMCESGDLIMEDVVSVTDTTQEHSNGEQNTSSASDSTQGDIGNPPFNGTYCSYDPADWDRWVKPLPEMVDADKDFTDYDSYYLVGNYLERIDEQSHHANTPSQVRGTHNSRVCDTPRGTVVH